MPFFYTSILSVLLLIMHLTDPLFNRITGDKFHSTNRSVSYRIYKHAVKTTIYRIDYKTPHRIDKFGYDYLHHRLIEFYVLATFVLSNIMYVSTV